LEQFNIRRRVQVELTDSGILIRPPEWEHHSHEHSLSSGGQELADPKGEALEASSGLLKLWRTLKSRFTRRSNNGEKS